MNAKTNQPTVDVPGVTVFFPASVHFDAADPLVRRFMRKRLAALAQACAMWDKELR